MAPIFTVPRSARILARVALHPAEGDDGASPEPGRLLAEAMFVASRHTGPSPEGRPGELSRIAMTHRAYEQRARWRTVPHGGFVGVATARFTRPGEAPDLGIGCAHHARSNPSSSWLAALGDRLLTDPRALPSLRFTTAPLAVRRGGRLETEWRMRHVTVRATGAVAAIMAACANGASLGQVYAAVRTRWPRVPGTAVLGTLEELVRRGLVLTDLLPDDAGDDPLGHLLRRLPDGHPSRDVLARLREALARADRHRVGEPARLDALKAARELADEVDVHERPLTVDVVADAAIVVPDHLRTEAVRAAAALWRIAAPSDPLRGFRERFTERYGADRAVPLLEATDPAIGIGLDTGDDAGQAAAGDDRDRATRRSRRLASLLGHALANGRTEVVLDDQAIDDLSGDPGDLPPPTGELCAQVVAARPEEARAGRLLLAVNGCCSPAGATGGRFARLLPDAEPREHDADLAEGLAAEIVVRPRSPEGETLAPATGLASWRLPVGVAARPGDLDPEDLRLVATGGRLRLWSARHDRPVHPALYSRLADRLIPPLAQFLDLLGNDGCRPLSPWSWGPLGDAPFRPRVRYGRTILAPAGWALPASLIRAAHDQAEWADALTAWRTTTVPPPPDIIVTDQADQRLPLDLRRADDRELLRRYVRRGLQNVCEPPGGPDAVQAVVTSPLGRHVLDLVVPLERHAVPRPPARPVAAVQRPTGTGRFLPGSSWLSLAIRSPATCQDQVLAALPSIADRFAGHVDTWFWQRHADAHGPHLRVRFHGAPAGLGGHVLPAISSWCADLVRQRLSNGFSVEPYEQEIERYGGPDAIAAAEQVFAADSRLVLGMLAATADPDQRIVAAAMSAAAIARSVTDGDRAAVRGRGLDRAAHRRLTELRPTAREAWSGDPAVCPLPYPTGPAWTARHETLVAYQAALKPAYRTACASAVIHTHTDRLLGDRTADRVARALAADLLSRPSP
jgi:thiopeptide-type bacteriocin biosynthesis protein